ncbi:exo-beta-N-acetylmuramidase NamZ family protein [Sutcliffiella cohnii]
MGGSNIIKIGLDRLIENPQLLSGKRIGLITNPTGINYELKSTVDIIHELADVQLVALYSVEHGLRGEGQAGENIETYYDKKTNLPVYSLYGKNMRPTKEMVKDIDLFLYDIQDVGVRFYTYISTMAYTMEAAKEFDLGYVVLDRPNPITGKVEGNILKEGFTSFVGAYPIATRYGLTSGELAHFLNNHFKINCNLTVFELENWKRTDWYDETGLPWVAPSPNLPTLNSSILYPGTCLLEGTNISEGRGTTLPFEVFGAPWMDSEVILDALEKLNFKGVKFRRHYFKPVFSKYAGDLVDGIQIHITNREELEAWNLGIHIINTVSTLYPNEFEWKEMEGKFVIDLLVGTDDFRQKLPTENIQEILLECRKDAQQFQALIKKHYLYS